MKMLLKREGLSVIQQSKNLNLSLDSQKAIIRIISKAIKKWDKKVKFLEWMKIWLLKKICKKDLNLQHNKLFYWKIAIKKRCKMLISIFIHRGKN